MLYITLLQVYRCAWEVEDEEEPLNCYYKRNCVTLDGEYVCRAGQCSRYTHKHGQLKKVPSSVTGLTPPSPPPEICGKTNTAKQIYVILY